MRAVASWLWIVLVLGSVVIPTEWGEGRHGRFFLRLAPGQAHKRPAGCGWYNRTRSAGWAEPDQPELTDAQRRELERRIVAHEASPDQVAPWEEVKAQALARARR
jgi:hypothetical protein